MRVLIACEYSGAVRQAFAAQGHDVMSCDLLPSEDSSPDHYTGDVRDLLGQSWDLMLAFPSCTYLCSSGLHWNKRTPGRATKTEAALEFVQLLMSADITRIAIENPVGRIGTAIRRADQYIHPHQFGHDASKRTGLWLKGLPLLTGTHDIAPRMIDGRARWSNQTDSGQNKLGPSETRWKERSRTYPGIARAMAKQWGDIELLALPPR